MYLSEQEKRKIAEILAAEPGIELAYLYGSYATGLAREDSDVDIGILLKEGVPNNGWQTEIDIALKLEDAVNRKCDVRIINNAPIYFLHQVVNKGKVLFTSSDKTRIDFEARVTMNYFDIKPIYDLYERYRDKRLERGEFGVRYRRSVNSNRYN